MEAARRQLTVSEFLDQCPEDGRHYQLLDGAIVAMAPPSSPHQAIAFNLAAEIHTALRANRPGCRGYAQAGIVPFGLEGRDHFEADLAVSCTPPEPGNRGVLFEPILIVEILSPSNERDDVITKLPAYKRIPSLREILYVESQSLAATVHRRTADGAWRPEERVAGPEGRLRLETAGLDLPLPVIYEGALP